MTHTIYVDDTVVIRRRVEVPERCPRCKRHYSLGDTVMRATTLRPKEEQLRLTSVLSGGTHQQVVEVKEATPMVGLNPRLIIKIECLACHHILAVSHSRMYELEEMDQEMATKLRGLLYDSNALDPEVQRKCFPKS